MQGEGDLLLGAWSYFELRGLGFWGFKPLGLGMSDLSFRLLGFSIWGLGFKAQGCINSGSGLPGLGVLVPKLVGLE